MNSETTIFIISNEPWGKIWFSKQHYANELTKLGYNVYFVNPVGPWRPIHLVSGKVGVQKSPEGIQILNYHNNLPVRVATKFITRINDWLNCRKIQRVIKGNKFIIWNFDPFRFAFISGFKNVKKIYHVADPYIQLPLDDVLAKTSDLVVCISPKYLPHYTNRNKNVINVPHGISPEEQQVDKEEVKKIKNSYGKFSLIVGTLNSTVDPNIFESIANSGFKLVIIGSENLKNQAHTTNWIRIKKNPNVIYLGPKHAKELKNYIHAAEVCITAYKFNLKKAVGTGSPLKILNYLAQYKPTVTSIDSEIPELANQGIYWGENSEAYMAFIKKGMDSKLLVNKQRVKAYLSAHMYPQLIQKIVDHLPKDED